jgi:imidazolonepropionase-like amidohydrolase
MKIKFITAAILASTAVLSAHAGAAGSNTIVCNAIFDSKNARFLGPHKLVFVDGKIASVTPTTETQTAMGLCTPGWIDLHVHLTHEPSGQTYTESYRLNPADIAYRAQNNGMISLRAGFTTVRDLGEGWGVTTSLRNAINAGTVQGPRIFAAGKSIATTGGHADPTNGTSLRFMGDPGPDQGVINSPAEARKAVRQRYKESSDVIKITATGGVLSVAKSGLNPQFTQAEANAIVKVANDYGLKVAAHGAEGMKRAILAGVSTIEHGTMMNEEIMMLMKKKGTFYVPTLSAGAYVAKQAEVPGFYVPMVAIKARAIGPQIAKTLAAAYKFGVPIAFGTDAGVFPHGENAREFELLVNAGVPLEKALQMATFSAAEALGESANLGQLMVGQAADMVVLPLSAQTDAKAMMQPLAVYKAGVLIELAQ